MLWSRPTLPLSRSLALGLGLSYLTQRTAMAPLSFLGHRASVRLQLVGMWECFVNCTGLCTVSWLFEVIYSGTQWRPPCPPCSAAPALSLVKACLQGMATQSLQQREGLVLPVQVRAWARKTGAGAGGGPLFSPLIELEDGFLLFVGLDGAGSKAPDFSNGISRGQAPLFHQVTGQHGASAAKAQGTVHSHSLRRSSLVGWSLVPRRPSLTPLPLPAAAASG